MLNSQLLGEFKECAATDFTNFYRGTVATEKLLALDVVAGHPF